MRIKISILALIFLVFCACATAPKPRQIVSAFPIEAPFDDVWTAIIESFAEMNLPIMNMEKDSGLITTDWIEYPLGKEGKKYCDCGGLGINIEVRRAGKFNVFAKSITDSSSEVRVTCSFQQTYETFSLEGSGARFTRNCFSTGKLEADMFEIVKSKLKIE